MPTHGCWTILRADPIQVVVLMVFCSQRASSQWPLFLCEDADPVTYRWDPASGLGTPNYPRLLKLFMSLPWPISYSMLRISTIECTFPQLLWEDGDSCFNVTRRPGHSESLNTSSSPLLLFFHPIFCWFPTHSCRQFFSSQFLTTRPLCLQDQRFDMLASVETREKKPMHSRNHQASDTLCFDRFLKQHLAHCTLSRDQVKRRIDMFREMKSWNWRADGGANNLRTQLEQKE